MFLPLSVLVYSHVTLHESLETGPGITSLLAIGVVRGELERKEQFYLHYAVNDGISRLSQLFCWKPDSPTENIPTYFNRHAYMMECDKTREVSYVSFKDFNPNGEVTFYDNTIYFLSPVRIGETYKLFSSNTENCTTKGSILKDYNYCNYKARFENGEEFEFQFDTHSTAHSVPRHLQNTKFRVDVPNANNFFYVDTTPYNSYVNATGAIKFSTKALGLIINSKDNVYSTYSKIENAGNAAQLFSMFLVLFGAIIFIPASSEITEILKMYQKPSVQQEKSSSMSPEIAKIYRIFMGSTLYTSDTDNTLQKNLLSV